MTLTPEQLIMGLLRIHQRPLLDPTVMSATAACNAGVLATPAQSTVPHLVHTLMVLTCRIGWLPACCCLVCGNSCCRGSCCPCNCSMTSIACCYCICTCWGDQELEGVADHLLIQAHNRVPATQQQRIACLQDVRGVGLQLLHTWLLTICQRAFNKGAIQGAKIFYP